MPHDKNGLVLSPGDRVTIEFTVRAVHSTEEYCNVDLVSVETMPPTGLPTILSAINTRQTVKKIADAAGARVAALLPLATFGKAIIESYFNDGDFGDLDGGDVQDKAVELGLLVHPEVAHDPDECEGCSDEPRSCYVLSAKAAAALAGTKTP